MTSEGLLGEYFSGALLTNEISFTDFKEIVAKKYNSSGNKTITNAGVEQWYIEYQSRDRIKREEIVQRIERFLSQARQAELRNLEMSQMSDSYTLEEIVNNLYNADQILATRLKSIDKTIAVNTRVLSEFNGLLTHSNDSKIKNKGNGKSLGALLDTLDEYKSIIQRIEKDVAPHDVVVNNKYPEVHPSL